MLVAPESSTPPLVTILSQFHPIHLTTEIRNIHLNVMLPFHFLNLPNISFPGGFHTYTILIPVFWLNKLKM
jgi:hypothetical protein